MSKLFLDILNISFSASWLIVAVMLLRLLLKNRAPKWIACLLWAAVGIRLVIPFAFESELSLLPSGEAIKTDAIYSETSVPEKEQTGEVSKPAEDIQPNGPVGNGDGTFGGITEITPNPGNNNEYVDFGFDVIDDPVNKAITEKIAETPENTENPIKKLTDIVSMIWLCGIAVMVIYAVVNYIILCNRVAVFVPDEGGIRRSEAVGSPFILGIFRPKIYLPFGLSDETEAHVVAHERAHLKRCDHLIKPLGYAILAVHWFNPLVWVAYVLLCRDIEMACDERVVKNMTGDARKAYATALLECGIKHSVIAACPVAFGEIGVKQRVKNALNYKKPMFWVIIAAVVACVAVGVLFLTNPKDKPYNGTESTADEIPSDEQPQIQTDWKSLDFTEHYFNAQLQSYNAPIFIYGETEMITVRSVGELDFIANQTSDEAFKAYAQNIPEDFFDKKMLLCGYTLATADTEIRIFKVEQYGTETIKMTLAYYQPEDYKTKNVFHRLVVAEIDKTDYTDCVITQASFESLYKDLQMGRVEYKQYVFGGEYNGDAVNILGINNAIAITNTAEFNAYLENYTHSGAGENLKDFKADTEFFNNNVLMVVPMALPDSEFITVKTDRVMATVHNKYIIAEILIESDDVDDCYRGGAIYAFAINKAIVNENTCFKIRVTHSSETEKYDTIVLNYKSNVFNYSSHSLENPDELPLLSSNGDGSAAVYIDSKTALDEFVGQYFADSENSEALEYFGKISDSYFNSNALVINYTFAPSSPSDVVVTSVYRKNLTAFVELAVDNSGADTMEEERIIVTEVKKNNVEFCNRFITKIYDLTGMRYYEDILKTYSLMTKYLFTENYESYIDDSVFDCPDSDEDLQYRWDCMINDSIQSHASTEFGYTLKDINNDNVPELSLLEKYDTIKAIFTYDTTNSEVKLLDAFWSRYECRLLSNGYIFTIGSSGADIVEYEVRRLKQDCELEVIDRFGSNRDENDKLYYYAISVGPTAVIDKNYVEEMAAVYQKDAMVLSQQYYPVGYLPFVKVTDEYSSPAELTQHVFGGTVDGEFTTEQIGEHLEIGEFVLIDSRDALDDFRNSYNYEGIGEDFDGFAENIKNSYFAKKMLIAISVRSANDTVNYTLSVLKNGEELTDLFITAENRSDEYAPESFVILAEIAKLTVPEGLTLKAEYVEPDPEPEPEPDDEEIIAPMQKNHQTPRSCLITDTVLP